MDINKYEYLKSLEVDCASIMELLLALNSKVLVLNLQETDLIEVALGFTDTDKNIAYEQEMNFIVVTALEFKQVALNHKLFSEQLAFDRLKQQFGCKN